MNTVTLSAIQLSSGDDVQSNLAQAERLLQQAKEAGANIAVLPENFAFVGKNEKEKLVHAEQTLDCNEPLQKFLSTQAKKNSIWIIGGTIPTIACEGKKVHATCYVFDVNGDTVTHYDKIHTFDVNLPNGESYIESSAIEPGKTPVAFESPFGRIGLSVCYDVRFPELYRLLCADIYAVPSAFTEATGQVHWKTLLKARAIENLCYVVAPNQGGMHPNGKSTFGHSLILSPWGETLAEVKHNNPGLAIATIDLTKMEEIRAAFPALQHRKIFHST